MARKTVAAAAEKVPVTNDTDVTFYIVIGLFQQQDGLYRKRFWHEGGVFASEEEAEKSFVGSFEGDPTVYWCGAHRVRLVDTEV